MSQSLELVIDAKARLGEGAIWHAQKQLFYWINILGNEVHIYDPVSGEDRVINVGQYVGTVVPRSSGGLMVALKDGFAALDTETEALTFINDPEADLPDNRFNDGKCDPAGRFWAGTTSLEGKQKTCNLWRLDADFSAHKMLEGVSVSNGIV